ncbi:MAG: hypothetical protein U1F71_04280 [Verrucomicrobiaceae bacterium]
MRFRSRLIRVFTLALACAGHAWSADLTEAQLRDGLGRLATLLAADVPKDARWVLVSSERGRFGIFAQQEDVFNSEGNAFLFDEKPGKEARIMVMYDGNVYPVKAGGEAEPDDNAYSDQPREFRATWKNADVARDVAAAVEWLKKEAKNVKGGSNGRGNDPFGGTGDDDTASRYAASQQTALFWSALLLHTGHDAPAFALATTALAGTDEVKRKELLDAFFDRIAGRAYTRVMSDFAKHRDWSKLRDALAALIKQFPLGWQMRDAVRVFHHHVTERAKLAAAPPLKTKSPLADADQKTLLGWIKDLEAGKQLPYDIWTLPHPKGGPDEEVSARQNPAETSFPRSQGLAAVPLLASLLADDTLTLVGLGERSSYEGHFWGGGDQDATEQLRSRYRSLQKPPTRSQLAWNALQRVLPQELQRTENDDLAEVIPDILSWHEHVKNGTPTDLALAYIESGNHDDSVLAHAANTDDPKKLARVEGAMIERVDLWDLNRMESFVVKLGPQRGPAFLAKVRQKLEDDLGRFQSDASQQERQRKQMESALKRLEAAAKGEKKTHDLKDILATAAQYDPESEDVDRMEIQDVFQQMPQAMKKLPAAQRYEAIAKALPDFKSPQFAAQMLSYFSRGDGEALPEFKPEERKTVLETTRPHWQKILDAEMTEERHFLTVQVVNMLQELAGIQSDFPLNMLTELGDRGVKLLHDRGVAILSGQQPEALPDPRAIKREDREKLLADWSAKSPADIAAGLATLEIDKLIALNAEIQRAAGRGDDLSAGLKAHINAIREIKVKATDPAAWQAWKGRLLDKDSVIALARELSATKTTGALSVVVYRASPLLGFTLSVSETPKLGSGWQFSYLSNAISNFDENLPKDVQRVTSCNFNAGRTQESWVWFDAPSFDSDKTDEKAAPGLKEMQSEARNAWQKVLKSLSSSHDLQIAIQFTTAPVSLAKKNNE